MTIVLRCLARFLTPDPVKPLIYFSISSVSWRLSPRLSLLGARFSFKGLSLFCFSSSFYAVSVILLLLAPLLNFLLMLNLLTLMLGLPVSLAGEAALLKASNILLDDFLPTGFGLLLSRLFPGLMLPAETPLRPIACFIVSYLTIDNF
tara:strand:- start:1490 stop:1933 length:444 start_codon:yes stop_codon:yes gene_type:complete